MTMNGTIQTGEVLGCQLAVTDYERAVAQTKIWAKRRDQAYLVAAANTHLVTLARHDLRFAKTMERFDLILPDGMPLIWCMNRRGTQLADRVYGPTFMLRCLEATADKTENASHYFLGGSEELLASLTTKLQEKFPDLKIAGTYSPPFAPLGVWSAEEDQRMLDAIAKSNAEFVWIGLGCPKQESWLARMKDRLPPAVYGAVGAAFAFHAGEVKQSPKWMQDRGLEWAFRLFKEPRRLWKRYFVFNTLFLFYLLHDSCFGTRRSQHEN